MCMQFVEDPQYNPEAQMFANVPTDFDYGNKNFHFMRDAPYKEKLLPWKRTEFYVAKLCVCKKPNWSVFFYLVLVRHIPHNDRSFKIGSLFKIGTEANLDV